LQWKEIQLFGTSDYYVLSSASRLLIFGLGWLYEKRRLSCNTTGLAKYL